MDSIDGKSAEDDAFVYRVQYHWAILLGPILIIVIGGMAAGSQGVPAMALIAFGLLLPHLTISPGWASAIAYVLWISLYVLWIGLLAGAVYGTGRVFPIAGAGLEVRAKRWQERLSSSLISLGAIGSVVGVVALLVQWRWQG